jgi:peptidyl-prolyl cis-trans isomerase SurA
MNFRTTLAVAVLAMPAAQLSVAAPPAGGAYEVNGIAAKVNGRVITKNEVAIQLAPIFAMLTAQYPRRGPQFESEFNKARDGVIKELIDRELIMDEFKLLGGNLKPHVVDEEVKRIINEQYQGDEAKFREELKRSRLTMEGYRDMTREKMIVQAMKAQQFSDAPPPLPGEVRQEYDKIKESIRDTSKDVLSFSKIFIPASDPSNPGATPEDQLALAEKIASDLQNGADFAKLAKQHSRDAFAEQGGKQEKVPRTDLSPEFAAIIAGAPIGKILGPLRDPQGFTIIKTTSIVPGPPPPYEEVRERIEAQVRERKNLSRYERWIESRRKRAIIEIR